MTGLIARRAWPKPPRRVGRGSRASGLRPSARALLSFQGPLRARTEGLSGQTRSAPKATNQYIARPAAAARRSPACRTGRSAAPAPPAGACGGACRPEAPAPSSSDAGRSSRPGSSTLPPIRTPPWSISRRASLRLRPNCSASSAGRWTDPFGPLASTTASAIVVGHLPAHVQLVEALLRGGGRIGAVEALHEAPGELALGLGRVAAGVESAPQQQPVVLPHRRVGDAHQLPEHLLRGIRDARRSCRATCSSAAPRPSRAGSAS